MHECAEEEHDREHEICSDSRENDHDPLWNRASCKRARIAACFDGLPIFLTKHADVTTEWKCAKRVLRFTEARFSEFRIAALDRSLAEALCRARIRAAEAPANALTIRDEWWTHADGESVCADASPLCGDEVTELVHDDEECKAQQDEKKTTQ